MYLQKPDRNDNDVVFVMKQVDSFLEMELDSKVIELLSSELDKEGYSSQAKEKLKNRLNGVKEDQC